MLCSREQESVDGSASAEYAWQRASRVFHMPAIMHPIWDSETGISIAQIVLRRVVLSRVLNMELNPASGVLYGSVVPHEACPVQVWVYRSRYGMPL